MRPASLRSRRAALSPHNARAPASLVTAPASRRTRRAGARSTSRSRTGASPRHRPRTFSLDGDLPASISTAAWSGRRFVDMPHPSRQGPYLAARAATRTAPSGRARQCGRGPRTRTGRPTTSRARMDFALRCAFAHGTGAIRTHLDSIAAADGDLLAGFAAMREDWRGRIELQAVPRSPFDLLDDEPGFRRVVADRRAHGGVLGGVTFMASARTLDRAMLDRIVRRAGDEGPRPRLPRRRDAATRRRGRSSASPMRCIRNRFTGKVLCGHCCSLALPARRRDAPRPSTASPRRGIAVVSLPMCNMYLQDRAPAARRAGAASRCCTN